MTQRHREAGRPTNPAITKFPLQRICRIYVPNNRIPVDFKQTNHNVFLSIYTPTNCPSYCNYSVTAMEYILVQTHQGTNCPSQRGARAIDMVHHRQPTRMET